MLKGEIQLLKSMENKEKYHASSEDKRTLQNDIRGVAKIAKRANKEFY